MAALGSGGPPELQNTLEILKTPKETLENYENIVKKIKICVFLFSNFSLGFPMLLSILAPPLSEAALWCLVLLRLSLWNNGRSSRFTLGLYWDENFPINFGLPDSLAFRIEFHYKSLTFLQLQGLSLFVASFSLGFHWRTIGFRLDSLWVYIETRISLEISVCQIPLRFLLIFITKAWLFFDFKVSPFVGPRSP